KTVRLNIMSNPFITDLSNKSAPVSTDALIIADSEDSNLEKNTQIGQVIANNKVVTTTGTITSGHLPVLGTSNQVKDSGIAVDTGQNLTNVGTINTITLSNLLDKTQNLSDLTNAGTARSNLGLGNSAVKGVTDNTQSNVASAKGSFTTGHIIVAADTSGTSSDGGATSQFLAAANNLSDVSTRNVAFDNIAPVGATNGDIMYYNGTHWIRLAAGSPGYILATSGGIPTWIPPTSVAGFADNALFSGTAGQTIINSTSLSPINLSQMTQSTTGNNRIPDGGGAGMKCQVAGTYLFSGNIAIQVSSNVSANYGLVFGSFIVQGPGAYGLSIPIQLMTYQQIGWIPVQAIIACTIGTVVLLGVKSITPTGTYSVADPTALGGNASYCSITRLI